MTIGDLDEWIEQLFECKYLSESQMTTLCAKVTELLIEESNVQPVSSPVTICGDIHGQFWDLKELFRKGGMLPETSYIFLGDFVDRGHYSLETISLLLALKARYPDRMTLLRGNHETRGISRTYGFYDECKRKYGTLDVYQKCCNVFDYMNIGAIVDGEVLCIHGGLSPDIKTVDQIRVLARAQEPPLEGAFCDLLWSDPTDKSPTWLRSSRNCGYLFGNVVTEQFNKINNLTLIARAHQLVMEGYQYLFNDQLVTVWSAPNYCYRNQNAASILTLHSDGRREITMFESASENWNDPVIMHKISDQPVLHYFQ